MEYFIGCPIPRTSDCEFNLRCEKGLYCKELKIIEGKQLYATTLNGDNYILFSSREEAAAHLDEVRNLQFQKAAQILLHGEKAH